MLEASSRSESGRQRLVPKLDPAEPHFLDQRYDCTALRLGLYFRSSHGSLDRPTRIQITADLFQATPSHETERMTGQNSNRFVWSEFQYQEQPKLSGSQVGVRPFLLILTIQTLAWYDMALSLPAHRILSCFVLLCAPTSGFQRRSAVLGLQPPRYPFTLRESSRLLNRLLLILTAVKRLGRWYGSILHSSRTT